jgi:uncharacterized membrane protein YdjX (TVP38/TMEM64 family)
MDRKTIFKVFLIFLISFFGSILLQVIFNIDLDKIRGVVSYFGSAAPVAYSILLILGLTVPFNPISDLLIVSLAALIFPPLVSVVATAVAHVAALTVNYYIGQHYLDLILRKLLSKKEVEKVENLSLRINLRWIFGLRFLLPLTAIGIDVISYAAGLAKLPFLKFLLVSLLPWSTFNILYFYSSSFLRDINPALIVVPAGILIGIPALIIAFRRRETLKDKFLRVIRKPF